MVDSGTTLSVMVRAGWEGALDRFGVGTNTDNGLCLLSFAAFNNLIIRLSHFQHPCKHQLIWRHLSGKDTAVLDYFLNSSRFRSSLKDVRAMRGPDCGSDHYRFCAKLQLQLQWAKRKAPPSAQPNWMHLMDPATKQEFQIALSNKFVALAHSEDLDNEEQQVSQAIIESAAPLYPPNCCWTQPWILVKYLILVDKWKHTKHIDLKQYWHLN